MTSTLDQCVIQAAQERGWPRMNAGESSVALALSTLGFTPEDVEIQFALGRYRIDFAFPLWRIALEADGWVHSAKSMVASDRKRDEMLSAWGWRIVRINTENGISVEELEQKLFNARLSAAAAAAGYWAKVEKEAEARLRSG